MAYIDRFTDDEIVEAFHYLDGLRASAVTNMFGAAPYIATHLEHSMIDARALLSAWMETFDADLSVHRRLEKLRGESA